MPCNCENSNCTHMQKDEMCKNTAERGKNVIVFLGSVCDDCYKKYPLDYRVSAENSD